MMKHKLPENWIAVNSKSHPDWMYYFNVKTNETTWIQPTLAVTSETSSRNNKDKDHGKGKGNKVKAKAREHSESGAFRERSVHKVAAKTKPQMKATCEKVHERSSSRSLSSHRSLSSTKDDKSAKPLDKKTSVVTMTPQMRLIYSRTHTSANTSSCLANLAKIRPTEFTSSTVPPRSRRLHDADTSSVTDKTIICSKGKDDSRFERQTASRKDKQYQKSTDRNKNSNKQCQNNETQAASHQDSPASFRERGRKENSSLRKNLAIERMQIMRKRQKLDDDNADSIHGKTPRIRDDSSSSSHDDVSVTPICRAVRIKRLRTKISKDLVQETEGVRLKFHKDQDKETNESKKPLITDNMTKDGLIEQANREIFYEEMDWEEAKAEEILLEVEAVRTQLSKEYSVDEVDRISKSTRGLIQPGKLESQDNGEYVVVDTNVFLSDLDAIEHAKDVRYKNRLSFIVIPWTVICELDVLKDKHKEEIRIKARKAIAFIHQLLVCKHPRIIGQTHEEATRNRKKFSLECPDDEILQCCLQIRELKKSVSLLSFDINLCNKAIIHKINMSNTKSLDKTDDSHIVNEELSLTCDIFEKVKAVMKNFLSTIVTKQMSEVYGSADWKKYVIVKPPWTIVTALKCAIKHWIAAINEAFHRRSEYILKELLPAFEHVPTGGRKLRHVEHILEKCSDLMEMVNTEKHGELMMETSSAITEFKKKCRNSIAKINQERLYEKIDAVEDGEEQQIRATKAFLCFEKIYVYARNICGSACDAAGIAHSFNFKSVHPSLSQAGLEIIRPEISRKVADLTLHLNKLLRQTETSIKYETLLNLQQIMNAFLPEKCDVEPVDLFYCIKLKEDTLRQGLRQLQELSTHFCALANRT